MVKSQSLAGLLVTLFDRRPINRADSDSRSTTELCEALLGEITDLAGLQYSTTVLNRFEQMDGEQRLEFFTYLNEELDLDGNRISELAQIYAKENTAGNFNALIKYSEPKRQELFRRLNQAPGATVELVRMRVRLLELLNASPELARTDQDFVHLLRSWFNRGFLVLRQITWDSPASILEKIIEYEAVHEIHTWDDLRRRLQPEDRRCFAFFHPAMPGEPLIFVEVALTKGIPSSIHEVLKDGRVVSDKSEVDTAVFYSISNCQNGLAGISFGNSLIKQVARDLGREIPGLKMFATLSPIPGLVRWLKKESLTELAQDPQILRLLTARYLLTAKTADGRPLDPVSRFHLGNGALVHDVHAEADLSANGLAQSKGAMVNYLYDLDRISTNVVRFEETKEIASSTQIKSLVKQASKLIETKVTNRT